MVNPPIAPVDATTKLFPPSILDAHDKRNATKYPALSKAGAAALSAQTGSAMEPWLSALGNRSKAPARILAVGDSILEGAFATARANRWVDRLMTGLRGKFPQAAAGGIGHLPPYYVGGIPAVMGNPYTAVSSSVPTADSTFGLGRRSAHMFASNSQSYTYTITGTSFWLWYTQGPSTGSFGISIDGAAATVVPTSGALTDGKTWVSPALTAGSHTVQITVASGDVYFGGLTVFNGDETSGVQVFESGHWGWKTTDWVNGGSYWGDAAIKIQPQLIMIALMTNDYQAGIDPATSKANLQTLITALRGKCTLPPTVVLITYPARGDVTTTTYPWSAYVEAAASIAASDAGVAHLDLSARYASPAVTNALGNWNGDKVHPTDQGHGLIAETVLSFISPR
jgi:lysophospholipase L1-like esterase